MPIPPLDQHGLLPIGVHLCTVDEIARAFGGATDGHRRDLFNGFVEWRGLIVRKNLPFELHVDGSFTTNKARPSDVDVALRLPLPQPTRENLRTLASLDELLNPEIAKTRYHVDPHVFHMPLADDETDMVRFFCTMKPEAARRHRVPPTHIRGILRVMP